MKNLFKYLGVLTLAVSSFFVTQSCEKPFDGVNAILTNVKIDHMINVQIVDANPSATNPYPANPIVTLVGDAVDRGLIYTADGKALNSALGSAPVVSNSVNLAVKPFTVISASQPLRFFIKATAANYIENSKEIVITSIDSLQNINLELLKLSSLPEGVANTTTTAAATSGTIATSLVVNVKDTETNLNVATVTFPASTVFKDESNNTITSSGNLNVSVTNFNASSEESVSALPGGVNATTTTDEPVTFILAGAADISATIGGKEIQSFSNPVSLDIKVSPEVFNPETNSALKAGDEIPIWSKEDGSVEWKNEGFATVVNDGSSLKTVVPVSHLSTWMVAFSRRGCTSPYLLTFVTTRNTPQQALVVGRIKGGNNQEIFRAIVTIEPGATFKRILPLNLPITITATRVSGTGVASTPFATVEVAPCGTSGSITDNVVSANPTLTFNLSTVCQDGQFRYSGPIEFKLQGTSLYIPFTSSVNGRLTTNLLEWDKTYDFRIIYRGQTFIRSRKVVQGEFRVGQGIWNYYGKDATQPQQTFFSAPTACN